MLLSETNHNGQILKKAFLSFILCLCVGSTLLAQKCNYDFRIDFEDVKQIACLEIDSVNGRQNSWQIGVPNFKSFTSAYSSPNSIVTRLDTSYPVLDSSSFRIIVREAAFGFYQQGYVEFAGYYVVNTDTLNDHWTLEFSPDNGRNWYDLLDSTILDTAAENWPWDETTYPQTSGTSGSWKQLRMNIAPIGYSLGVQPGDTLQFKISFFSDSIDSGKEGVIFDDFDYLEKMENITEYRFSGYSILPNPSSNKIRIFNTQNNHSDCEIILTDYLGREVLKQRNHISSTPTYFDISRLHVGLYTIRILDVKNGNVFINKILKTN